MPRNMTGSLFLLALGLSFCGCATSEDGPPAETAKAGPEPLVVDPTAEETKIAARSMGGVDAGPSALNADDLSILRDEKFRRRVIDSMKPETDIEPGFSEEERPLVVQAYDLLGAGKTNEVAAILEGSRSASSSAVLDFLLGNAYYQTDKLDHAAAAFRAATQKHPKFLRAWKNLGQVEFRRGNHERATEALTQVIELGGDDAATYGFLGVTYAKAGNHMAAETAFRRANLLAPESMDWKIGLAECFLQQRRYAESITMFDELLKAQPDKAELWLAQGEAYALLGEPMKAAENFEMVDRLGKSTVRSLNNLGDIYTNEKLYDMAVGAYLRALELDASAKPDRAIRAAHFMSRLDATEEALALVSGIEAGRSQTLLPEQKKELLHLRARLAVKSGDDTEGIRVLEEIVHQDPLDGDALIQLGRQKGQAGDIEKASFYFERAANIEEFEGEATLRHGEMLVKEGRYGDAIPLLERAFEIKKGDRIKDYLDKVKRAARSRS